MPSNMPPEYALTLTGTSVAGEGAPIKFGAVFGFDATQVIVANDGAYSLYFSLATTAGSTSGFEIKALEAYSLDAVRSYGFSVACTATSTSESFRLGAWTY